MASFAAAVIVGLVEIIPAAPGLLRNRRPMRFKVACLTAIACGIAATVFGLLSAYHLPDSAFLDGPEQGREGPETTAHEDNDSRQSASKTSDDIPLPPTKQVPPTDILSEMKRWGSFRTRYGIRLVKRHGSVRTEQRIELSLGDILVTGDEQTGQAEQGTEILAPRARQATIGQPATSSPQDERIPIPGLQGNEFARDPGPRIRRELFRDEPARYVVIEIKMDYSSKSLPLEYLSWNSSEARDATWAPILVDQDDNPGRLIRPTQHSGHFTVQPDETIRETLVFEAPAAEIHHLRLVLPCGVFGTNQNRKLGIEIPLPDTNLDDTQE